MIPGLFTDLYALNTAYACFAENMNGRAVFELVFRTLPASRNYLLAGGLRSALLYVSHLRFKSDEVEFLTRRLGFPESFGAALRRIRFTGDIYAIPEGTPVFAGEPVLQITAPIVEAQLIETALVNIVHFETVALTKAQRIVSAAKGKAVVECGSRRVPGYEAALALARAMYLAGGQGTSNAQAGRYWNIPVFGTVGPAYIQAHDSERAAFEALAAHEPPGSVLVDTYDIPHAVSLIIELKRQLRQRFPFAALRIGSGDLASLSRQVRRMLDEANLHEVRIFASGDLDEYEIERLCATDPPIDMFGVGARIAVSRDAPEIDLGYNLVEYERKPRCRLSAGRTSYPGRKQVFREFDAGGMPRDTVTLFRDRAPGIPLLTPVMLRGRVQVLSDLETSRAYTQSQIAKLSPELRSLRSSAANPDVTFAESIKSLLPTSVSDPGLHRTGGKGAG